MTDRTTDAFNVVAVGHLVMQPCQGVEAFIVLGVTVVAASALFHGATTASFLREPMLGRPPLLTTDNMTKRNGT